MVEILCTQRGSITSYGALSGRRLLLILPCCRARTGPAVEPERGNRLRQCGVSAGEYVAETRPDLLFGIGKASLRNITGSATS